MDAKNAIASDLGHGVIRIRELEEQVVALHRELADRKVALTTANEELANLRQKIADNKKQQTQGGDDA